MTLRRLFRACGWRDKVLTILVCPLKNVGLQNAHNSIYVISILYHLYIDYHMHIHHDIYRYKGIIKVESERRSTARLHSSALPVRHGRCNGANCRRCFPCQGLADDLWERSSWPSGLCGLLRRSVEFGFGRGTLSYRKPLYYIILYYIILYYIILYYIILYYIILYYTVLYCIVLCYIIIALNIL